MKCHNSYRPYDDTKEQSLLANKILVNVVANNGLYGALAQTDVDFVPAVNELNDNSCKAVDYGETAKIVNRLKDNGNSTFSIDFADFGKGMDAAALGNMLSAGCNEEDELKFSKEMEEARLQNFRTVTNITRYGVGFKVAILKLAANTDSWYVASRARGESEYNFYTGPLKFGRVSISTGWKVPQDILDMCDGEYPSTVIHVDCEKAFATTVSKNSRNAKNRMTLANFNLDVVKRNLAEHIDYIYAGYLRETATSKPLTEIWFDDYPMADGTYGKLKAVPYDVPYKYAPSEDKVYTRVIDKATQRTILNGLEQGAKRVPTATVRFGELSIEKRNAILRNVLGYPSAAEAQKHAVYFRNSMDTCGYSILCDILPALKYGVLRRKLISNMTRNSGSALCYNRVHTAVDLLNTLPVQAFHGVRMQYLAIVHEMKSRSAILQIFADILCITQLLFAFQRQLKTVAHLFYCHFIPPKS
jgi:hypothetical protein